MLRALILAALAWLFLSAQAQPVGNSGASQAPAAKGNESAPKDADVVANTSGVGGKTEAADGDSDAEQREKRENDRRDLKAQEDMAYWAQSMFWAAFAQAVLSLVGIVLIYVTFKEARRAANSGDSMAEEAAKATLAAVEASNAGQEANRLAREAQREARTRARWEARNARRREAAANEKADAAYAIAERNADAAVRHVKVVQDTARLQARAYVGFWEVGIEVVLLPEQNDRGFAFRVRWKNTGTTPAHRCKVWMLMRAFPTIEDARRFDFEFEPLGPEFSGIIAPGAIMDGPTAVLTINQFRSGSTIIAARVEYADVFSKKVRVSEVRMVVTSHPNAEGGLTFTYVHAFPATAT
jgi:hypothetical protein